MKRACLIGAAGDAILDRLPAALELRDCAALVLAPERLADARITLDSERLELDREQVDAIVFRAATNAPFSASFPDGDHAFCDAETRAIWLAAVNLPQVVSFNRLDAIAWFETEHWSVWRRVLARRGVQLAPCEFGYARGERERVWAPFSSPNLQADPGDSVARASGAARFAKQRFSRTLVACGQVVSGRICPEVDAATRALADAGVRLAAIATDERGDVAFVDTLPQTLDEAESAQVVALIADEIARGPR